MSSATLYDNTKYNLLTAKALLTLSWQKITFDLHDLFCPSLPKTAPSLEIRCVSETALHFEFYVISGDIPPRQEKLQGAMSGQPPVTNQPQGGYGVGYNNPQMAYGQPQQVPAYQPMQVGYTAQPGETVVVQPTGMHQYQMPQIPNCPPGMEYLASLDKVTIDQVVHLSEGKLVSCSDITNDQLGISGETGTVARISVFIE